MVVHGLHSFSHEIYREVVYEKYIGSSDALTRWHHLMARFFGQLPPCDRKLVCLPYHLEVAGSWSKVKNCLTEIDMFKLWWTPKFKKEFIKFWVSLTARPDTRTKRRGGAQGSSISTPNEPSGRPRPVYDIVEEYARSLDEYRDSREPKDEEVAETILQIGDFLIEFATLGHELKADVPASIHPVVPSQDLCALGVPHIIEDEEGRSVLVVPSMAPRDDGPKAILDAPTKPNEDFPMCTTYFFHRWMWIQFPFIALGNCGQRYFDGIKVHNSVADGNAAKAKTANGSMALDRPLSSVSLKPRGSTAKMMQGQQVSRTFSAASFSLPELKFTRKAARSMRRVVGGEGPDDPQVVSDKVARRLMSLQDEIQNLREEYDFISGQKTTLNRRLDDLKMQYFELRKMDEASSEYDKDLQDTIKKEEEVTKKLARVKITNQNLKNVLLMCSRHPPENPALVAEVEHKLDQDAFLLAEIKARLWEQRFERQSHLASFRKMKALVQQGVDMHTKLLEYRYGMKRYLQTCAAEDSRVIQQRSQKRSSVSKSSIRSNTNHMGTVEDEAVEEFENEERINNWQKTWQLISARTGITDPDIFFHRLNNGYDILLRFFGFDLN